MDVAYFALSGCLVLATLIPFLPHKHWSVRWFDFAKLQFMVLGILTFCLGFALVERTPAFISMQILLLACLVHNGAILIQYTRFYRLKEFEASEAHSESVTVLSANVLQFNTQYDRFVAVIRDVQPDLFLTMESNEDWDTAMKTLEKDYPYKCKVPLENTYGMHLYSRLEMTTQVHYFVADDIPSIEAKVKTRDGYKLTVFCIHPPPPSPTEEPNSKERDGELLSVAKKILKDGKTTLVVGDFNNVAWSRSSVLFRKTSRTIDPRIGRGLNATFHAKYWFFRFPIDQLFHTADIFTQELTTLPDFGSDHFPLFCRFTINKHEDAQEERVEELEPGEMTEVNEAIAEGIAEESDREEVATE